MYLLICYLCNIKISKRIKIMKKQLYHGSPYLFEKFETSKIGTTTGTGGAGFGLYFTDKIDEASGYGDNIYTVTVNLKKGLSNSKKTLSFAVVRSILMEYEKIAENSYVEAYRNFSEAVNSLYEYSDTDSEIIGDIINAAGCKDVLFSVLNDHGYNYVKANGGNASGLTSNVYVMFLPSDIEILTVEII